MFVLYIHVKNKKDKKVENDNKIEIKVSKIKKKTINPEKKNYVWW
uniref:Uncharacterized protein n=1 Tax=viral metagenome TaxID=1070528 RepID=A0A6C0D4T5_9ZZZZ